MEKLSVWQLAVKEQEGSGKSVAAFCRERGLKENSFHYWRKKLGGSAARKFVQVRGREPIEISLSSGVVISVPAGTAPELFKQLIEVLSAQPE